MKNEELQDSMSVTDVGMFPETEKENAEPTEVKIDLATLGELVEEKKVAMEKYDSLNNDLMKKSYPVEFDKDKLERLKAFYLHSVKWKYNQALGVVEVVKAIDKLLENQKIHGDKTQYRFKGLTVQAICYHLSEYDSVGYASAADFLDNLYKPFNEALKLVNSDANEIQTLAQSIDGLDLKIASIQQGVPIEKSRS